MRALAHIINSVLRKPLARHFYNQPVLLYSPLSENDLPIQPVTQ